ncbi:TonB-dependent receptor [Dyadobacter tibetensis]|uniref:TonB-dependent receptor n=1 Tax=Dyadobacter tibetensis TaxID=1211851 RepID=UPI000471A868|nr:TonB-dependent receptor [Dyadobacter tibetensis]
MKKLLLVQLLVLLSMTGFAQSSSRITISGFLTDSSGKGLPEATVMLLLPADSSLATFERSDKEGGFVFKNVKRQDYLLKATYVGYLPFQYLVKPTGESTVDLGSNKMAELNQDLYEVVIKTARAPLSIRGDTVEYDPRSFKVPPGSTVEDLLRRLPGMEVEQDGSITAQGETVKRVTVDGKRFFGDDTKAATKNLPAEAIEKVQVFNEKSEQSRLTGIDDGKHDKTLNLQLKDSHKKGGFGKVTAAAGTDKRLAGKINYNRFNEKNQFAIIGLGNNTNSGGMSWDDYQDFKGSQSFNWGDDGDFGFGGGRYISFGGDDESLTIQAGRGGQNRGYNKNFAGGANYNYDTKETKINTSYYFNENHQDLDATQKQTRFLDTSEFTTLDTNSRNNMNRNHRFGIRFEKNIDSLNILILLSNSRIGDGSSDYKSSQRLFRGEDTETMLSTLSTTNNYNEFDAFAMGNTGIYRRKFAKKGRNVAVSLGYNINNSDGKEILRSTNKFFREDGGTTNRDVSQDNLTKSLRSQVKASLLYIEPLSKRFVLESFYNFSQKKDDVNRQVYDVTDGRELNRNLSRYYINKTGFNRVGTSLRYSNNGFNLAGGLAWQQIEMNGKFAVEKGEDNIFFIDRKFANWTPNFSINYDLKSNRFLYGGYSVNIDEPAITALQPIIDYSNPLYIRVGNPNLVPTKRHSANLGYNSFNPSSFVRMYISGYFNYYQNQVIYNQQVDENLVTTTTPMNIDGGKSLGVYGTYGFPIVKTKSNLNINLNYSRDNNLTNINGVLNKTLSNGYGLGLRLDYTPSDKFTVYTDANWNIRNTSYSISSTQDQKYTNSGYGAEMNIKLPMEVYFNSSFRLNSYVNDRFDFDQSISILNCSVYRPFLKSKKGEIRLSAYDVFNQNRGINQGAYSNIVSYESVRTLGRYFMLSLSYNMRGMNHSVRRNNNF